MKKRITKIWGVGLVIMLLASLLIAAAPVSAGTLSWSAKTIPETTGQVLVPGSDVNDFDASVDGETVWAALLTQSAEASFTLTVTEVVTENATITLYYTDQDGNTAAAADTENFGTALAVGDTMTIDLNTGDTAVRDVTNITHDGSPSTGMFTVAGTTSTIAYASFDVAGATVDFTDGSIPNSVYKSTGAGKTWSVVTNPTGVNTSVDLAAVAPDNASVAAIVADGKEVYVTVNGGTTWKTAIATVAEGSAGEATALYDIAISAEKSGANYVAVAGIESAGGNVWYFDLGVGGYWHETNDRGGFNVATTTGSSTVSTCITSVAVEFSPNFASDSVLVAVTADYAGAQTTDNVNFEMYSTSTLKWNNAAGFGTGYPVTIASGDGITGVVSASIALAPTYLGDDDAERVGFVGLAITGGETVSGVVRLKDTTDKLIDDGIGIHSVSYDGTNLVAGRYDNNYVRYCDEPLVTTPTFYTARSLKRPGIDTTSVNEMTKVKFAGDKVMAGTRGNESAFAVSEDAGLSFNDISLIDTTLTNLEDFTVSADGGKYYLATDDDADLSVWRYDSSWERVLAVRADTGYIIRSAPDNADILYVAKTGSSGKTMYYTQDAGQTKWFTRTCKYDLSDLAVESEDVAYVAVYNSKAVSKTTNGGFIWGSSKDTDLAGGNVYTVTSLSEGNVIVGSTTGYVSYSIDSGSTWTRLSKIIETGAGQVQVTASGLADGDYIYAASDEAATHVNRWQIGTSTAWKDLEATTPGGHKAKGISLYGSVLYVATDNSVDSSVLRTLSPTVSVPLSGYWSTLTSAGETFSVTPKSLKVSGSSATLWAIDTTSTDELFYFTDILSDTGPTLTSPADGKKITVNPITGKSYDVTFAWERPDYGRSYTYNLYLAYDSGFKEYAVKASEASSSSAPAHIIGPSGTDGGGIDSTRLEFMPGTTYYWKVRVATDGPVQSPYSETRSFTIEPGAALVPDVLAPANGASGIGQNPSFSWTPVGGANEYHFVLARDVNLTSPVVDIKLKNTGYAVKTELEIGTTYYWRVKPIAPVEGDWSAIANFTVKEAPVEAAPPVIVKEVPAPIINIPQAPPPPPDIVIPPAPAPPAPIAPAYIWAIIVIGAVLVIAVIILILRTRRAV